MKIVTLPVLAGAYKGKRASLKVTLTHSVEEGEDVALCGQPNMADQYSVSEEEQMQDPTCPKCMKKLKTLAEMVSQGLL